ncbi:hypothetical protein [Oryza sativa Japonica Group]|uniref:Uncharacterized protein n=1 Tax=Oryza sativa subsp. japonica TaxID=39947 RepID=Q8LQ38_ORYSJ|nr:hypothetical protein [Oryza sativa Japonica Group]
MYLKWESTRRTRLLAAALGLVGRVNTKFHPVEHIVGSAEQHPSRDRTNENAVVFSVRCRRRQSATARAGVRPSPASSILVGVHRHRLRRGVAAERGSPPPPAPTPVLAAPVSVLRHQYHRRPSPALAPMSAAAPSVRCRRHHCRPSPAPVSATASSVRRRRYRHPPSLAQRVLRLEHAGEGALSSSSSSSSPPPPPPPRTPPARYPSPIYNGLLPHPFPATAAAASTRGHTRPAASPRVALASLRAHATPWTTTTMTMDADKDGRCWRQTDAGAGGGGLTTAAPGGEDDGASDGRDGVARNEGNSYSDGVF